MSSVFEIHYDRGTLVLKNIPHCLKSTKSLAWDERTKEWRCLSHRYREIILKCHKENIPYTDKARHYKNLDLQLRNPIEPRPHQAAAMEKWLEAGRIGTVCLPTGAGKTILALLMMQRCDRPTLVIVPTIDLLVQWQGVIEKNFGIRVGVLGGGQHDIRDVTVSTYDSACIHFEKIGDKFGFVVFDECHHLPAPQYVRIAESCIAPFRLGLSATVERSDGRESVVYDLCGPLVYEAEVQGIIGQGLSPYNVKTISIDMSEEEREQYEEARAVYTSFIKKQKINFSRPDGWMRFVSTASRSPEGREAMKAYRRQKKLAQASDSKVKCLWNILTDHLGERIIVFTDDNEFAYRVGAHYFLPVLTHQTKSAERKEMLEKFRSGEIKTLVTSKVLNEGVDVPEASVGVVMSGSGAVREHVQRLGRILRFQEGKKATLYEFVSKNTSESYVNRRRRQHHAYQRSH